ncbi:response regulator transcription factor [Leptospirillum ferriphilum]|jgi:two-component system alkaline phosphatase synthesis response regulator PhoP|uniref:Two component transcriptional regulator, winged helix family n=2 Tax=Leptospirillum TaxID=179 RepID=A0A094X7T4_9BACT|nr:MULTISPECIES: response regulator transcription factor [Leptospirillum]EDZ40107.1 MAG: Putative two component transcriptional regulator, winged helix family [Leptospirillum sp. Group II '5-way CG']EIJ76107.1 MAG: Putative two component transcriptional regulator, winged helix family [Leptospirillum sp. Group II 'C75']KGA94569.1 two component transcriptional regulator, winged helix family [Leptospirillum ferriphilum]
MEESQEMPVVLIVDDEEDLLLLCRNLLTREGFRVVTARDGEEAVWVLRRIMGQGTLDLVILDIMLPLRDGVEVVRFIRSQKNIGKVPILALSAVSDADWKIRTIEEGADDFLAKPFSTRELVARVHALARRVEKERDSGPMPKARYDLGELVVDTYRYETRIDGREIRLTPIEFRILVYLVSHENVVIRREELMKVLWGESWEVDEHNLNVHMWALRRKLGEKSDSPRFIETLRGTGYRFRSSAPARMQERAGKPASSV